MAVMEDLLADLEKAKAEVSASPESGKTVKADSTSKEAVIPEPKPVEELSEEEKAKQLAELEKENKSWKHKYGVLQGMYVKPMSSENKELKERLGNFESENKALKTKLEELTASLEELKARPLSANPDDLKALLEKRREVFGLADEEYDNVDEKIANARLEKHLKPFKDKIKQLESQVVNTAAQSDEAKQQVFFDVLTKSIPDWEEIDKSAAWDKWLKQSDELSGKTKQQLLEEAFKSLNVSRVAKFFDNFKKSVGKSSKSGLDSLVEPSGKSRPTNTSDSDSGKKIYTMKDFDKFTSDITSGKYKGREKERATTQKEFETAFAEGRCRD